jgi:hypothetical protein
MSYQEKTLKRLFARSQNQCAIPQCTGPIVVGETVVGEICHIRARRKNGPRFDPSLTLTQRDTYENLLLLCRTCHKLIDSNEKTYSVELLSDIKAIQDNSGGLELNSIDRKYALLLIEFLKTKRRSSASAKGDGVNVAIGGDNSGNITINQSNSRTSKSNRYAANCIGADANLSGYTDYLFSLAIDYWDGVPAMNPGRLGRKIKTRFRLKQRTRNHLTVDRFNELVDFLIKDLLEPSPVGKRHQRNGTKLCRTFDEWRTGPM